MAPVFDEDFSQSKARNTISNTINSIMRTHNMQIDPSTVNDLVSRALRTNPSSENSARQSAKRTVMSALAVTNPEMLKRIQEHEKNPSPQMPEEYLDHKQPKQQEPKQPEKTSTYSTAQGHQAPVARKPSDGAETTMSFPTTDPNLPKQAKAQPKTSTYSTAQGHQAPEARKSSDGAETTQSYQTSDPNLQAETTVTKGTAQGHQAPEARKPAETTTSYETISSPTSPFEFERKKNK